METETTPPRQCRTCHAPMQASAHQNGPRQCIACARSGPPHRESEASQIARDAKAKAARIAREATIIADVERRLRADREAIQSAPPGPRVRVKRYSIQTDQVTQQRIRILAKRAGMSMTAWVAWVAGREMGA